MPLLHKLSELLFGAQAVNAFNGFMGQPNYQNLRYQKEKEYIAREAAVGARILGPVPSGHTREFFCLDVNTWIWHESWRDESGKHQEFTVNYEVDPSGILKRVNGSQYRKLEGEELRRFCNATQAYRNEVKKQLYSQPATTAI